MVAEAFHWTDYESEHVADTAIFSNLTIQSVDEKLIIIMPAVLQSMRLEPLRNTCTHSHKS